MPKTQRQTNKARAEAAALIERVRGTCPGDGNDGIPVLAVSQRRRTFARGLRTRIVLRLEDGTPAARLLRP